MIQLDGVSLRSWPLADLRHVRDLVHFEGPLLSHFEHPNGDDYLFYWVDCDGDVNRWMVLRVSEASILRLVNRFLPLDNVIPDACRDGFVYFVDVRQDDSFAAMQLVALDAVPDDYQPELGAFLDPSPSHGENSYSVIVEGGWTVRALGDFPSTFAKVYSVLYATNVLRLPAFEKFPWRGGFSAVHFYNWVASQIPSEHRAVVSAMQYSSPGFMRFALRGDVADGVARCIADYKHHNVQLASAFADLAQYIRKHELNRHEDPEAEVWKQHEQSLIELAKDVLRGFSSVDGDRVVDAAARPFEAAKIAMSFYRRVRELVNFEKDGMVRFPAPVG